MPTLRFVLGFLALTLVVALVYGVEMALEDRSDTDAGTMVLQSLVMGFLEVLFMLVGG